MHNPWAKLKCLGNLVDGKNPCLSGNVVHEVVLEQLLARCILWNHPELDFAIHCIGPSYLMGQEPGFLLRIKRSGTTGM